MGMVVRLPIARTPLEHARERYWAWTMAARRIRRGPGFDNRHTELARAEAEVERWYGRIMELCKRRRRPTLAGPSREPCDTRRCDRDIALADRLRKS
jgi:hypothetical protein